MSAKYQKEILKALGGVDFTKCALPTIFVMYISNGQKMAMLKNAVNLSNITFSVL